MVCGGDELPREGRVERSGDEPSLARGRQLAELGVTEGRARGFETKGAKARATEIAIIASCINAFARHLDCSQVTAIGNRARY